MHFKILRFDMDFGLAALLVYIFFFFFFFFFVKDFGQAINVNEEHYSLIITNFLWPVLDDIDANRMWLQHNLDACHTIQCSLGYFA